MIDARSGIINRQWYTFFLNLFDLLDAGTNTLTMEDLQQAPPIVPYVPTTAAVTGKFSAYKNSSQVLTSGFDDPVVFQVEDYDEAGNYDPTTGLFTATVASDWLIGAGVTISGQAAGNTSRIILYKNGSVYKRLDGDVVGGATSNMLNGTIPVSLNAGDTLGIRCFSSGSATAVAGSDVCYFTGVRVR
jgi:hypothetical protein